MAYHLLAELHAKPGIILYVLVLNNSKLADELKNAGVDVTVIDENKYSFFSLVLYVKNFFSRIKPDIIHSHRYKENFLCFLSALWINRVKLLATQHGLPEVANSFSFFHKLKEKLNFFILKIGFDKTIAVSSDIEQFFRKRYFFSEKKVSYIRNGIPFVTEIAKRHSEAFFVIGSSGRLVPVKDFDIMVKVAAILKDYDIKFVLAGEGSERQNIEKLINANGLHERFQMLGHLDDMEPFYQGIHLFLNTSLHEGIPMTILEAMAHGVPIVAPKVGGIPEVIKDGSEGFLIPTRDPDAFAEKCLLLYNNPDLWGRMSQAARLQVVENYSSGIMADKYISIYYSLFAENS